MPRILLTEYEDSSPVATTYEELEHKLMSVQNSDPNDGTQGDFINPLETGRVTFDIPKIRRAYELANGAHFNVMRESGEPYITHPIAVADILLNFTSDSDAIVAALLHDVVEDTATTVEHISRNFGADVAFLVDGVTKISKAPFKIEGDMSAKEKYEAENIRKIVIAMSKDLRVILIKLADRIHNIRTLHFRSPLKQRKVSAETLAIYAPLAHRLGIYLIKNELENECLKYLDPYVCTEIETKLEAMSEKHPHFIEDIISLISSQMPPDIKGSVFELEGRVKSIYSIRNKLYEKNIKFEDIYDTYAIRIIVDGIGACYKVMGIIHSAFTPITDRFKDYIATPKPNGYQSLHTTVFAKDGTVFEVQIRTLEMHYASKYGIAAHWKYKLNYKDNASAYDPEKPYEWIRNIVDIQQQAIDNPEEIKNAIKDDLATEEVYVFTKDGEVKTLPQGSTVIDLAYNIHTELGHYMTSATINGKPVDLATELQVGDKVVINKSEHKKYGPSKSWLDAAKMAATRTKINTYFRKKERNEKVDSGRRAVAYQLKKVKIPLKDEYIISVAAENNFNTIDDFYAAVAHKGALLSKLLPAIKAEYEKIKSKSNSSVTKNLDVKNVTDISPVQKKHLKGIIIDGGIDNLLVKFAQCCNPIPGDEVAGFITRGRGVTIHKKDCYKYRKYIDNIGEESSVALNEASNNEKGSWVNAKWNPDFLSNTTSYAAYIVVIVQNIELMSEIFDAIRNSPVSLTNINSRRLKNGNAEISVSFEIKGSSELKIAMKNIEKTQGVISVSRTGKPS